MDREIERLRKRTNPDGYENDGTPYWILPSDRKTYSYEEWYEQDRRYYGEKVW